MIAKKIYITSFKKNFSKGVVDIMAGSYSQDNIAAMQEDALKRVRDMQKKAQQRVKQNQPFDAYDDLVENNFQTNNIKDKIEKPANNQYFKDFPQKNSKPKTKKPQTQNIFSSLIKNIIPDMESDRIFLLFLILMLQKQRCDNGLLLALFYIMM